VRKFQYNNNNYLLHTYSNMYLTSHGLRTSIFHIYWSIIT